MPRAKKSVTPPKAVTVLGRAWTLQAVPGLIATEGLFGDCDINADRIRYATEQTAQALRDTLLHETCHAIDETLCLRMTERQVSNLATVLLAVLRDNPKFTQFLLAQ
jgi:hypothetical protein